MSSPYPTEPGNVFIPSFETPQPAPLSIEDVRTRGVIVSRSEDGRLATVEVQNGLVVSFCAVTLNPDGTIDDFAPRPVNRYVTYKPYRAATTKQELELRHNPPQDPPIDVEPPQ